MPRESRAQKSETLTIRLDPKSRFILELLSRAKGQTITTVVDRAIIEAASNLYFDDGSKKWQDIWSVSEGVRSLRIAIRSELYPSYEDEQLAAFARAHSEFFYTDETRGYFHVAYIDIIWPRIKEFLKYWNENKSSDYFGAGKKMSEAIQAAGVLPPSWPPGAKSAPTKKLSRGGRMSDIVDDDIPF